MSSGFLKPYHVINNNLGAPYLSPLSMGRAPVHVPDEWDHPTRWSEVETGDMSRPP